VIDWDNEMLMTRVTEEQILKIIQSIEPDKAPGPYGFSAHFYRLAWHQLNKDLIIFIEAVRSERFLQSRINSTSLALIP